MGGHQLIEIKPQYIIFKTGYFNIMDSAIISFSFVLPCLLIITAESMLSKSPALRFTVA